MVVARVGSRAGNWFGRYTENHTARELLAVVLKRANSTTGVTHDVQKYGPGECYQNAVTGETAFGRPKYVRLGNDIHISMKSQTDLMKAIKGDAGARLKDKQSIARRQAGWKSWAFPSPDQSPSRYWIGGQGQ